MARTKVKMECLECGKKFSISPRSNDPHCPKCGSVDVDVVDEMLILATKREELDAAGLPVAWAEVK